MQKKSLVVIDIRMTLPKTTKKSLTMLIGQ